MNRTTSKLVKRFAKNDEEYKDLKKRIPKMPVHERSKFLSNIREFNENKRNKK